MQRLFFINKAHIGWPERILASVFALLLLLLGLVFGTLVLSLGLVAGLGLTARIWWLRRRLSREAARRGGGVIEGEYRVLERHAATSGGRGRG